MAAIMSSEDDFQGKRKRASVMTSAELCMISQHYVENYSLFHAAHAGSSRDPSVKEKKKCLEDLADVLEQAGYERRSTAQLDQRIRDTLRRAKQYTAAMKKDQMQTGGGPPKKFDIPAHVQIILKGCGDKPRLHGLEKPMEVCGTYDSDLDDDFFERKPPKIRHIEASPPQQPRHTDTSPQLHPSHVEAITPQKPRLPKNYSGPQPHLGETCSTPQPRLAEAYSTPQSRHPRRNQPQHPTRSLPSPHEKENQSEL
ncbi:hypothetical protein Y032_1306g3817 [Ancylostoma ceylanicum]|uniref:Uncharacterized protein n=2 Tax=Ancylostoma ceylanicum TaxID=53326 RepID=A0A016W5F0_9BILA|nr:hypothetical protein Y032_1306g3817 [Ancylostoma ceylanicum]